MRNAYVRLSAGLTGSCLAALALACGPALAQVPEDVEITVRDLPERAAEPKAVPGEIIVKLRPGVAAQGAIPAGTLVALGLRSAPRVTSGGELIYQLTPQAMFALASEEAAVARAEELAEQLSARPDVEYAQPNWILRPSLAPNDPLFPLQWHYRTNGSGSDQSPGGVNLVDAWDTERGNAAVVVAVLDTGILPTHPDIAGSPNLAPGYDMISDPFIANDGGGRDADPTDPGDGLQVGECGPNDPPVPIDPSWHGSHVAGTVGVVNTDNNAGVAGTNWFVTTVPVRVLGKCGGTNADINDGIRWAAGLPVPGVPANPQPARVINMSLGAPVSCTQAPSLQAAINDAVAAGTVVVVAAGNEAIDVAGSLPGGCANVIAVAASDARGHLVTRYSNFGAGIDILAPGGDLARNDNGDQHPDGVLSTVEGGYALYNGTSMAAPHAAGVAALMLAVEPALTPAEIEAQIKANAIPRNSTHCPRPCGAGLLNAAFPLPAAGPEPVIVPVFYTTDRRVTYSATPQEWYGSMRGPLSYGRVEVTIPLDHRLGHLEAPSFWRFEFREDPSKHVVFFSLEVLPEQKFYRELRSRVAASPQDDAFVFIHGYNVSFEDAARRTGQIAYDLNFQGAPILYSWPSRGELDDYPTDLNNAEWTVPHLQQFLSDLRERSGAQKIHLIAHSMGNKPLVSALAAMVGDPDAGDAAVFNQVLLTAPDIDADIFRTIAEQVVVAANRVTLYASQRDKALQIARQFHGLPRAGDASEGLVIVDGIDTIEASAVDTSLVGHSYYGDNRSVLSDIFAILKTQASPMERFGLRPAFYQGKRYWIFRP